MDHLHGQSLITPESLIGPAMAQAVSANYDTLCADKVDGVCLMLELELAFDLQFQERFAKPSEQAGAIMNMVEGFYKDQFGIVFDTLSLTFLDNAQDDVFSKTTVAEDLLSDVSDKRDAGALDFLKSDRSIFHFVSGRDFNGGTAGMAWVGSLCGTGRYATGVTNAFDSNAITALVVAHEIGHNLGARHDGQDGEGAACQSGQYIMGPSISANANSFSRCSYDSVTRKISTLGAIERCFNFPADVSLLAVGGNPSEVAQKAPFQANFRIDYQDAGIEKADRIAVGGVIGEGNGRLIGVSLGRTACTLTGSTDKADGFSCPEAAAKTGLTLSVQADAPAGNTTNGPETLDQAQALWSDKGIADYQVTIQKTCFCPVDLLQPIRVTVVDGEMVDLKGLEQPIRDQSQFDASRLTIAGLFEFIERSEQRGVHKLNVDYDARYGFPLRIDYDGHEMIADDEYQYELSDFQASAPR